MCYPFWLYENILWQKRPLARASALWDVARECFVDATLGKYAEDDRTLAFKHLSQLSSQDLVVMDRGYPSRDWMAALQQQKSLSAHVSRPLNGVPLSNLSSVAKATKFMIWVLINNR